MCGSCARSWLLVVSCMAPYTVHDYGHIEHQNFRFLLRASASCSSIFRLSFAGDWEYDGVPCACSVGVCGVSGGVLGCSCLGDSANAVGSTSSSTLTG